MNHTTWCTITTPPPYHPDYMWFCLLCVWVTRLKVDPEFIQMVIQAWFTVTVHHLFCKKTPEGLTLLKAASIAGAVCETSWCPLCWFSLIMYITLQTLAFKHQGGNVWNSNDHLLEEKTGKCEFKVEVTELWSCFLNPKLLLTTASEKASELWRFITMHLVIWSASSHALQGLIVWTRQMKQALFKCTGQFKPVVCLDQS